MAKGESMTNVDRLFWLVCILVWIEGLQFARVLVYDYACYMGYLS